MNTFIQRHKNHIIRLNATTARVANKFRYNDQVIKRDHDLPRPVFYPLWGGHF